MTRNPRHLAHSLRLLTALFLSTSYIACASTLPSKPSNAALPGASLQSPQVTTLAQARAIALRYLHENHLQGTLSEGTKSHLEGWSFLVTHDDSLIVGDHFFLRVLPDGTVVYRGGA